MSVPTSVACPRPSADRDRLLHQFVVDRIRLRALARQLLHDAAAIDDALQEAYIRALTALPRFRGESSLGTWVHRIVRNVCLDEIRRARRLSNDPGVGCAAETANDPGHDASVRLDLAAALAQLEPALRATVVLVDGWGMDYASAGRRLGIPSGTVGSRLTRARADLRRSLAIAA